MFLPWRDIHKGEGVFTTLPVWWDYGDLSGKILFVLSHITISLVVGLVVAFLVLKGASSDGSDS